MNITSNNIYVVHTQYYEDYNMEASNWDEGYYKFKGGTTYFLFGFDKTATAVAFVHKELCYPTEFPSGWEEYTYDDAHRIHTKYLEDGFHDVKKIDLHQWMELNDGGNTHSDIQKEGNRNE